MKKRALDRKMDDPKTHTIKEGEVLPTEVAKGLVSGASTLGIGVLIERSCGFLANILAARFGGAQTFGAYALAISTANNVSAYAAGGIGSTAIRFSGEYAIGTPGYTPLARALAVVAAVSAAIAASTLWVGAAPLAHLLHKPELTGVLRWAGFSAAAIILLECCRGFFVGQRRLKALLCLSGFAGIGMLTTLPLASSAGPKAMLISQSSVAIGAVLMCLLCYRRLRLASPVRAEQSVPVGSLLRRIWSFSLMQIAGIVSMNIAGWWLTTLIAKSDTTMAQMGFFAVALQMRNLVALVPSLLIEGSFAEMTDSDGDRPKTPDQVTAICTYVATLVSVVLAGFGIIAVRWGLPLIYGKSYASAYAATSIALATAVIHMGSGAASLRVSILSIRTSVFVNTAWALFVGAAASVFLLRGGDAAKGAAVYLAAHVFSAALFLGFLKRRGNAPEGMIPAFSIGAVCIIALAVCSLLRTTTGLVPFTIPASMVCIWAAGLAMLIQVGKRRRWLPSRSFVMRLVAKVLAVIRPTSPIESGSSGKL
jgi:O-antigen/teichoic acid export membrane protein